jgi:uncharacterized protein
MSADYFNLASGSLTQDWSNAGLITTDDDWALVPSIQGFRGDNLVSSTAVDPQTIVGDSNRLNVIANQTNPGTLSTGGVAEFAIANPSVALNGSGTADAPYLALYLNATGRKDVTLSFNARDLDGSVDNAIQQLAVQYRLGDSGNWINLPAGFVADATTGPSLATLVTPVSVTLPAEANGVPQLQLRVITSNAAGNDEWVGIDDIVVSSTADGGGPTTPVVNLSLSSSTASEAAASSITVTATASAAVVGNQTVSLAVAGAGVTASDYLLSNSTITIPDGQTSGSVTFIVADDATVEGAESATLSISNPSAGIALGATTSRDITLVNNDGSFLTKVGGASSALGAEIPAFDPGSDRLFVVAGSTIEIYTMSAAGALTAAGTLAPGFTPAAGVDAVPNSVATKNGIAAVAWATVDATSKAQGIGHVSFYDAATGTLLKDVDVGYLPDMLTFTPDGSKVLVANEGEPNSYGQADSFDPVGSVSIIDLSGGVAAATVQDAGFAAFNSQMASLKAAGVRIFGPGASVAQDLEPEYIAVAPDGLTARITLQENNAVAVLDIASGTITQILPLGLKDYNLVGNGLDASDRDVNGSSGGGGLINIQNWPVVGAYMPDAIASYSIDGQTFYISANEGDARDYTGYAEEVRVGSSAYTLDPTVFPNAADLKLSQNLGRLTVTTASGDTDGDGDFDQIVAFGGRSFTIWDSAGAQVYDSGDQIEQITAQRTPQLFNSEGTVTGFDSRSDNKGPEPEGVVTGVVGGRTFAFIGLERVGDVMVWDVSVPAAPVFVQYINTPEDRGVEGLTFVSAADSPTGKPLLITAAETSNTVSVFEIAVPPRIADIQGSSHISPYAGQAVQDVPGIVTAVAANGFYLQDPQPDANPATSEGIFVFTSSAPTVQVGAAIKVSGTVTEFRPGNNADNLTTTEITSPVISVWADAPAGGITPVVLGVDRIQPTQVINDDFTSPSGNVETGGDFDPANEGIDFYESLEGMLVQVNNPLTTSPTNAFGEIVVLPNGGAGATSLTERGGSLITAGDFNPERLQIDNLLASQVFPTVDVGARLNDVTGVIGYSFSNYELLALQTPTVAAASSLEREVTLLGGSDDQLTVATFNVENLDPGDGAGKFSALAGAIVSNLRSPDIVNLEEVQDNNGPTNNGTVDANVTLQTLIDAIAAAGGPTYAYQQLNPVDNQDGGEPGGNIRVAFLYNPARVDFVNGSLLRLTDPNLADGDAFASSRKPLVGSFVFNGEEVTIIGNHFNSKGGDDPLFGPTQPPVLSSEVQRNAQAEIVSAYVEGRLASDPKANIIIAGDLNDFEFSHPVTRLEAAGLTALIETLPANERYTYNFEGNAQALDHLMASGNLMSALDGYDVVHINSEFAVQVSDHDPVVARFTIPGDQVLIGGTGRDTLVGDVGDDMITGGGGRDLIVTGAGSDTLVYGSMLDFFDLVLDFQTGQDHLDISALLAAVGYGGADPVGDGYLSVLPMSVSVSNGPSVAVKTTVLFDADGSAGAEVPRPMVVLVGVVVDDAGLLLAPPVLEI